MANRRLSMRKIKEVLRLTHDGRLSERQVAQSLNLSRSTVKEYRVRAERAGAELAVTRDSERRGSGTETISTCQLP